MSSITFEPNSVQRDSIQETNGNEKTNVDQKSNKNQMEEFPIADKATKNTGEQSESRQSGAEPPREGKSSAEQAFCKTGQSEHANKYNYSIFAGYRGEQYIHWILKQILPAALYRTWSRAVSFQVPGKSCYVGAARIAQQEKAGVRKIEIDLAELEARGLMKRTSHRQEFPQEDGSITYGTVKTKDFSRLYDLAYEYHLWLQSPDYIPAEWESAEDIRTNVHVFLKLMRFDNYRHILMSQKPGPKAKRTPLQEIYHCQLPEEEQNQGAQDPRTDDPKANLYLNVSANVSSPYRESKNLESYLPKENSNSKEDSEEGVFASVVNETIGNEQYHTQTKADMLKQETNEIEKDQKEIEKRERNERNDKQSNTIETRQKEENVGENAKEVEEHTIEELKQNPMAMITFLLQLNEQERAKQEQQQAKNKKRHHQDQPKRKRLGTPELLARTITQMVQDLGEHPQSVQSDITRITKIYWACTQIFTGFTLSWFLEQLTKAFVTTCKRRKIGKRVPYFFTTLQNLLGLTNEEVVYIRSEEALYCDGDLKSFVLRLQHHYERSGSPLEYQEWVKQTHF